MARSLFHPDNALMISIGQITDCIFLSLFWLLGCFPVITAGAATAALYDSVYHGFRKGDKHSWQRFLKSFRENLGPSLLPTVLLAVAAFGWVRTGIWFWNGAALGQFSWAVFSAAAFVLVVLLGMGSIVFPLLSRFETTTLRLLSNSFRLGMARLPLTIGLGILNSLAGFLCIRYIFPLFFLPALVSLISTLLLEPMFRPYMPTEEDDEEKDAAP